MFTLSSAAAQQIQKAIEDSGAQDMALRVAARREKDGSLDFGMGFDDVGDNDTRLLIEDVPVVIAAHHADLLDDTMLDFVEIQPGQFNFVFVQQESAFETTSAGGCGSKASSGGGCGSGGCGTGGGGGGGCGSGSGSTH